MDTLNNMRDIIYNELVASYNSYINKAKPEISTEIKELLIAYFKDEHTLFFVDITDIESALRGFIFYVVALEIERKENYKHRFKDIYYDYHFLYYRSNRLKISVSSMKKIPVGKLLFMICSFLSNLLDMDKYVNKIADSLLYSFLDALIEYNIINYLDLKREVRKCIINKLKELERMPGGIVMAKSYFLDWTYKPIQNNLEDIFYCDLSFIYEDLKKEVSLPDIILRTLLKESGFVVFCKTTNSYLIVVKNLPMYEDIIKLLEMKEVVL